MLDTSRQWGKSVDQIRRDHVNRYQLAAKYATGRVLDAACGCGYGSWILNKNAQVVVGVDASTAAINWAEQHFPGPEYVLGRIEQEPWSGRFETVVSLETIEHIKEPEKALEAFRRACIGKFVASVPNQEFYPFKAEMFSGDESPHYRHYTPGEFQGFLEKHGFRVLEKFCQVSKQEPALIEGTAGRYMVFVCE